MASSCTGGWRPRPGCGTRAPGGTRTASTDVLSCYKDRQIGLDAAYFAQWAARVFALAKERKAPACGCS